MTRDRLLREVAEKKIIAIVRGVAARDMPSVARALLAGGVSMIEVTFDHSGPEGAAETLRSLSAVREALGDDISLGAGTVLTPEQVVLAKERGAGYIISPNVDEAVIAKTRELEMVSIPGALSPTEVAAAFRMGGDVIKLFPAGLFGADYIKALRGPLPHIPMAAVGGVEPGNIGDFFKAGVVCVGVGGNLVNAGKVAAGKFEGVTAAAKAFRAGIAN